MDLDRLAEITRAIDDSLAATCFVAFFGTAERARFDVINTLTGAHVLPLEMASRGACTIVRHGSTQGRRVHFDDVPSRSDEGVASEEKAIAFVEVCSPEIRMRECMAFVDVPARGVLFGEALREIAPRVRAAVLVFDAGAEIAEDDLALTEEVAGRVSRLSFVVSAGHASANASLADAHAHAARRIGERLGRPITAHAIDPGRALAEQPCVDLRRELERNVLADLTARARVEWAARRDALARPLEDARSRLAAIASWAKDPARTRRELTPLFDAGEARLRTSLDDLRARFLSDAMQSSVARLAPRIGSLVAVREELRRAAFAEARSAAVEQLEAWRQRMGLDATARRALVAPFIEIANAFLAGLSSAWTRHSFELWEEVTPGPDPALFSEALDLKPLPVARLFDRLLPRAAYDRALELEAAKYLEHVLDSNALLITEKLEACTAGVRDHVLVVVRARVEDLWRASERAFARAQELRAAGEDATRAELERLDALGAALDEHGRGSA
jgi:hypothetical protein